MNISGLDFGAWGYALAALGYCLLAVLLLTSWRGRLQGALLLLVCLLSSLWAGALSYSLANGQPLSVVQIWLELLRDGAVLLFLYRVLTLEGNKAPPLLRVLGIVIVAVWLALVVLHTLQRFSGQFLTQIFPYDLRLAGHLLLAIAGLILVEQLFRNTQPQQRWAIKYLCLGLGGLFAYDFFLYSNAVLFNSLDSELWDARGFIHILVVPLIAVSAARNPQWSLEISVSRQAVFHSVAVLAAGIYLLLMAMGGYAIRYFGGNWGSIAQVIFLFGAALILFVLMFSGQVRARMQVFLSKHFFNYKYDYRKEWLKFIGALASEEPGPKLGEHIVFAIAGIVDSPGGLLWVFDEETGCFELGVEWNATGGPASISAADPLITFFKEKEWLLNLDEFEITPEIYDGLTLPDWLGQVERAWLLIPLFQNKQLVGMVLLLDSRAVRQINWEDRDLLKTAATQAASYLALSQASMALANARQFEAFNRLSAYVVHDIKNVVGQLSLIVTNSKFGQKREFIDDAFATVENAVNKMQRMLTQLRQGRALEQSSTAIRLVPLLKKVIQQCSQARPVPVLDATDTQISVVAEQDRLAAVIEHVVQNAQQATPDDGRIQVRLTSEKQAAVIEIEDNGCGMDQKFVRERLFRPFDTTKGNAGMGIGAYECREFVRGLGGEVHVNSEPGVGTLFQLIIPKVMD